MTTYLGLVREQAETFKRGPESQDGGSHVKKAGESAFRAGHRPGPGSGAEERESGLGQGADGEEERGGGSGGRQGQRDCRSQAKGRPSPKCDGSFATWTKTLTVSGLHLQKEHREGLPHKTGLRIK